MTERPLGVAVVGFWHVHARDYANEALRHPSTRLVSGWDADAGLADDGTAALGIRRAASLDDLLADPEVEAITVTTATADHTEVISRAIAAGRHVFTEKLLAPTVPEAEALASAARERGVVLGVSLPRLTEPVTVAVRDLIARRAIGDVTYARVRLSHDGWLTDWLPERFADPEAAIGGAFTDLGCHPAYLIQLFLGAHPRSVAATFGSVTSRPVEDNAVVTALYDSGAIGVAEASFVATPGSYSLEVRGTRGSLLHGFGRDTLIGKGGELGDEWTDIPLPQAEARPFDAWIDAIRGSGDTTANVAAAIELTRLVEAAARSAASGAFVTIQGVGGEA